MNVLVYDVAASSGGALSVLKDYYNSYVANSDGNHYYFVISTPELASTANITILRYPWIKKSWFHRLWFDYVVAPELVKKLKIDTVFSLQNTLLPRIGIPQTCLLYTSPSPRDA